jgi:hypothetical protein
MAMKRNLIEWIQALDKEEYIGYFDGQKYFVIKMLGYIYRCKSLPVVPLRRDFTDWDKNLSRLKKRAQEEFDSDIVRDITIERIDSFETKQKIRWRIFQN